MISALGVVIGFSGVWVFLCNDRNKFALPLLIVGAILLCMGAASSRDLGQWGDNPTEISQWYRNLKQPDNPTASCCGEADAYWCDGLHVRDGATFCTITDDRDNEKLMRTPVPIGTEIEIPDRKLNRDPNPTGHAIVFLSLGGAVYCYVGNSGS